VVSVPAPEKRTGPVVSGAGTGDHTGGGIEHQDTDADRQRESTNYGIAIFPQHAAMLHASGITVEQARARNYQSVDTKRRVRELGITRAGCNVPGLLIPSRRVDGSIWGFQYRPDEPRERAGKVVKYETPTSQRNGIDVPPGVGDRLGDPAVELWVTEGVKKADAAAVKGLACVALPGVWSWRGSNPSGGKTAVADWHDIALNDRKIVLAFDSDVAVKPAVRQALDQLSRYLTSKGALVQYCHLPDEGDGKTGLDDYLSAHTVDEVMSLVRDQPPDITGAGEDVDLWPSPAAPLDVARRILHDYTDDDELLTLRHWRGGWMRWDRDHWIEVEEKEIRASVYRRLEAASCYNKKGELESWNPKTRSVSDVIDALAGVTHLPERIEPPYWLPDGTHISGTRADAILACQNVLLDVSNRHPLSLTPALFNRVAVPFDYQPQTPEPLAWKAFLDTLWPDDQESVDLLGEFFGYVLSGRTDLQKILLMIGPTRSGKGTIARVMQALVGAGNVAGPTLASLSTNFGLWPLLNRPLAIVSDARLGGNNAFQVVERLLSISGEDSLTVDRKYLVPWTGKIPARFVIASNELPRFGDASGAITNRFVVLTMTKSFLNREDPALTGKLLAELPGILLWSLDGLDRLTGNGHFTVPAASTSMVVAMNDLVSPMSAFVRDWCQRGPALEISVTDMFAGWNRWCEENGRDHPGTVQTFGRDLVTVAPGVHVKQVTRGHDRIRTYVGVSLLPIAHNGFSRVQSRAATGTDGRTARSNTREKPLWPVRSCVIDTCEQTAVDGTQFCASHPNGEPSDG
jgi:putative DNA primase/helicase